MEEMDFLSTEQWHPLSAWGLISPYAAINVETILHTWYALIALFIILLPIRYLLNNKKSVARFLALYYVNSFVSLIQQSLGPLSAFRHISFIIALFTFILV